MCLVQGQVCSWGYFNSAMTSNKLTCSRMIFSFLLSSSSFFMTSLGGIRTLVYCSSSFVKYWNKECWGRRKSNWKEGKNKRNELFKLKNHLIFKMVVFPKKCQQYYQHESYSSQWKKAFQAAGHWAPSRVTGKNSGDNGCACADEFFYSWEHIDRFNPSCAA